MNGMAKWNFILLGISSVVSWASLLSTLDYFSSVFGNGGDVYFFFPLPIFLAINIISLTIPIISTTLSIETIIIGGQMIVLMFLGIIPLLAYLSPDQLSFWLIMIFIFIMNSASSVMQCSCFVLVDMFPSEYLVSFTTSTGLAGILIPILRGFFLFLFAGGFTKEQFEVGTLFFFPFPLRLYDYNHPFSCPFHEVELLLSN